MSGANLRPTDIGVRFKPPAIVLFYEDTFKILHKRTMPIRGLRKNSVVNHILQDLKERHEHYLENVPDYKLEKMIRLLQEQMKGNTLVESINLLDKEYQVDPDEDLNVVDEFTLKRKKEIMDQSFIINQKTEDDPDFEYDVQVEFTQDPKLKSEWDTEEEDKDD